MLQLIILLFYSDGYIYIYTVRTTVRKKMGKKLKNILARRKRSRKSLPRTVYRAVTVRTSIFSLILSRYLCSYNIILLLSLYFKSGDVYPSYTVQIPKLMPSAQTYGKDSCINALSDILFNSPF